MKKFLALIALILLVPRLAHAQAVASSFDPCAQFPKSSAAINISSATTTQIVALQAGAPIYVCGFTFNQVNGAGSLQWEYGTGSACATGTTALTGAWFAATTANGTTNSVVNPSNGAGTNLFVPAGNALCLLSTGTIQQSGWVTYVQQSNVNAANFFDPCNVYPKATASIAISSATTTQLVPLVAGTNIYVCSMDLQQAGGAGPATLIFEYGTGSSCATGTTSLTGPISGGLTAGANATTILDEASGTDLLVPTGNALCALSTTTITQDGWITYVQR